MERKDAKKDYRRELTDKIIEALKSGTAPWQKPWDGSAIEQMMPFNPVSGTVYRGGNVLGLMMHGCQDPRWCTYKQAHAQEWQVRKGEKSSTVEYWKFDEVVEKTDEKTGEVRKVRVQLERPRVFYASVFNASQMDNVPELDRANSGFQWEPMEMAERILQRSGVRMFHDQQNRAFYSVLRDEVHLPPREAFESPMRYYATALHEIGHSTGHSSRLGRELANGFGSVEYAKEELRAEMASLFLSYQLGIPHDIGQHASYVSSWIKVLQEDKNEIFRAAKDAEHITEYIMELAFGKERTPEKETDNERTKPTNAVDDSHRTDAQPTNESPISALRDGDASDSQKKRLYLNVPFSEKEQAKGMGAKWDKEKKLNISSLEVETQFRDALLAAGLVVDGSVIMDGKWHRTTVSTSSKTKALKGVYIANLDSGFPNGFIQNFDTGYAARWIPKGLLLSAEQRTQFERKAVENRVAREKELAKAQELVAARCVEKWETLPYAESHPYLDRKGIPNFGLKVQGDSLITPIRDADGKIWSLQYISADLKKSKLYEKNGRKTGNFHVLGELEGAVTVIFGEGYATCASLHMSTQLPVVEVFDSNNISSVLRVLGPRLGNAEKIICADNDEVTPERIKKVLNNDTFRERFKLAQGIGSDEIQAALEGLGEINLRANPSCTLHLSYQHPAEYGGFPRVVGEIVNTETQDHMAVLVNNVGMEKAWVASKVYGAKMVAPVFTGERDNRTDFNDLHASEGLDQVRSQISTVVDLERIKSVAVKAAKVSIGESVTVSAPCDNQRYVGKVVANAGLHAVQDIGRQTAVAHPIVNLDKVPAVGSKAVIEYEQGRGVVKLGLSKGMRKER